MNNVQESPGTEVSVYSLISVGKREKRPGRVCANFSLRLLTFFKNPSI